jgi:metal-responsive CopG/Arc/MetJ family transcriptional regulator
VGAEVCHSAARHMGRNVPAHQAHSRGVCPTSIPPQPLLHFNPPQMRDLLAQIAARHGRDITKSQLIREAIRHYLDEQADVVGSRRHFQKSFQMRLERLERSLLFQMNIVIYLLSAILADDSAFDDAIIAARRDGARLMQQIEAVRDLKDDA